MCCMRLAANAGPKKVAKNRHLGTIPQLCVAISSKLRHVSTIGKKLLSSNISSTRPHNMVNFGPLAAEILSLVWGTAANFNGFGVLAALLHGTVVVGVSQTAALNRGRHLYSAGRLSRWALAHILVSLDLWATVCKTVRSMLSDRFPVCDVGVLWPNGLTDQDESWRAGRSRSWPHCVRWGLSSPSPKGTQPPIFRPISVAAKWLHGSKCHLVLR